MFFCKFKLINREAVTRPKIGHGNWFQALRKAVELA